MTLTVGSLFSGIGGLDLGLERAGMKVIWQSEIDPYCNKVLKKHWPEVTNYGNIKNIDWRTVERPDIICGGYPCQPFSTAGKRRGTDDPRHLWPWVRDAISALRPDYAILENVRGHTTMGGLQVIGELAQIGYNAEWRIVSAAGLGAPHRRERLFIVAYPDSKREYGRGHIYREKSVEQRKAVQIAFNRSNSEMANAYDNRRGQSFTAQKKEQERRSETAFSKCDWWKVEPCVDRVANGVPSRVDRLRGLGNAVVPQVAEYIGRLVMDHANTN